MKTLEELGISPWPWHLFGEHMVCYKNGTCVCDDEGNFHTSPDARLIAAAPELYECLREATENWKRRCIVHNYNGTCKNCKSDCIAKKWRAALAKAAGEETKK